MPFGVLDTQYIDFPQAADTAYLQGLELRGGTTFQDLLVQLDGILWQFNQVIDPFVAELIYPTTETTVQASRQAALIPDEDSEYSLERPAFVEPIPPVMLPIRRVGKALGFTEDGLREMRAADVTQQLEAVLLGFRIRHKRDVLFRLFSPAELRVDKGTTATSPGFAGSGTGNNVFQGTYPNAGALEEDFTHYLFADTAGGAAAAVEALLDAAIARWRKMNGDQAIPDLVGSEAFITLVQSVVDADAPANGFVGTTSPLIVVGNGETQTNVDASRYAGVYKGKLRVRHAISGITTAHAAIMNPGQALGPTNILRWRYDDLAPGGRNAYVRYRSLFPLDQAEVKQKYGIGVRDRLGAILLYAADAAEAYAAPTFTF